jgi:hypothetical protein
MCLAGIYIEMAQSKRILPLPIKDYLEKYAPDIDAGRKADARRGTPVSLNEYLELVNSKAPLPVPWDELRNSWIAEQLRKMARENQISVFKGLLMELLVEIEVPVPEDIFTPWPKASGAPKKKQTDLIHACWVRIGKPSLHKKSLATMYFGTTFTTAPPPDRKKMIDRCRRAVERVEARRNDRS